MAHQRPAAGDSMDAVMLGQILGQIRLPAGSRGITAHLIIAENPTGRHVIFHALHVHVWHIRLVLIL